ncbi:MAG: exonuclease domain-containing protein [Gammaproteobacteria bacterium]|nr:exonuclease domain-containing protein [Gammaproteobacteria bacterium]
MNFVAIDVETANADMASICQVGIAKYVNNKLVEEWSSLIDPEDYFDYFNIKVHGITEKNVVGSPIFPKVVDKLDYFLTENICVSHTHFDRVSISRALNKYDYPEIGAIWLDSAMVARRTWTEFSRNGYGLSNVCDKIGYKFKHHDALEDAKAAAHILMAAVEVTGLDLESWLKRVKQPLGSVDGSSARDGDTQGKYYGEVIAFTGALQIPRREAADIAASIGCSVTSTVTKTTSILVVGDQDLSKLSGYKKSSKHRKAEQLIRDGQKIRIIKETDFKELVRIAHNDS